MFLQGIKAHLMLAEYGGCKMDRISFIEYNGKKIFYVDYSDLSADMLTSFIADVEKQITSQPKIQYCHYQILKTHVLMQIQ